MAKAQGGALRGTTREARPVPAKSAVGESITAHLRNLQQAGRNELHVEGTLLGYTAAATALLERGMLVSFSVTRDGRALRMSTLVDKEWIEWFATDDDSAGELGAAVIAVLGS